MNDVAEAIECFGIVKKNNYLAHTIRAIEVYIKRTRGISYHIFILPSQIVNKSRCEFFDKHCVIRVPYDIEEREDCEVRVRLAHEIAHVIWNFDSLETPELLDPLRIDTAEEVFAWKFARNLIQCKSEHYRRDEYKKFVFDDKFICATIQRIVTQDGNQEIIKSLEKELPFV